MQSQVESGLSVLLRPGRGASPALDSGQSSLRGGSAPNSAASSFVSEPSLHNNANGNCSAASSPSRSKNEGKINPMTHHYRLDEEREEEDDREAGARGGGDEEDEDDAGTEDEDMNAYYYRSNTNVDNKVTSQKKSCSNNYRKSPTRHVLIPPLPPTFSFDGAVLMSNCHFCGALFPKTEEDVVYCSAGCKYVATNDL